MKSMYYQPIPNSRAKVASNIPVWIKNQDRPIILEIYKKLLVLGDILSNSIKSIREERPTRINTVLIDIQSSVEGVDTIKFTRGIQSIEQISRTE